MSPPAQSLPPVFLLFILALLAAVGSVGIALLVLFLRRRRGATQPTCGHCGYDVQGLPTFICPECGSDLRRVGIRSDSAGAHPLLLFPMAVGSSWKRILVWTVVYIALFLVACYVSINFILNHDVFPHSQAILDPASRSYRLILDQSGTMRHVAGSWAGHSDKIHGDSLTIQVSLPNEPPDPNTDFRIDLKKWSCRLYHWKEGPSPTIPPVNFDRGQLEKFFKEKGIDTADPAVSAEIASLMLLIHSAIEMPLHRSASSAKNFTVVSAGEKSDVQLNTRIGAPGIIFLAVDGSLWLLTVTGVVIVRMFKLGGIVEPQLPPSTQAAPARLAADPSPQVARTITVLFSDIKDYTARSARASRTGAIEMVRRHRDLAAPVIRLRRGNLVKTIGDALLVTFDSATDAVLAGLEIQAAAAVHNAVAGENESIPLRIAVATGEVIVEAGDVYGETVNLAARLQSVAAPGEVLLSAATRALVNSREVQTESHGEHQLAGFKLPVEAFVALPIAAAASKVTGENQHG
jgi:class 3 adenylate cyclase